MCHGVVARGSGWGVRGTNLGVDGPGTRDGRTFGWGLKWELVVGEFRVRALLAWVEWCVVVRRIFVGLY